MSDRAEVLAELMKHARRHALALPAAVRPGVLSITINDLEAIAGVLAKEDTE